MNKKLRNLIILAALLVIAIAVYFLVDNAIKKSDEAALLKDLNEEAKTVIGTANKADIVSFSYMYEGTEYTYVKEDNAWIYEADRALKLDQDRIEALLNNFVSVTAERLVEENAKDLSEYGLDNPVNYISLSDKNEGTMTYCVGNTNDITGGHYIMLQGEKAVYISSTFPDSFEYTAQELAVTEESALNNTAKDDTESETELEKENK